MNELWRLIQGLFSAIGACISFFIGGMDGLLYALLAFVIVDYITGVLCGIYKHKLSSEIGFKGICKKVFIFLLVGVGHVLDTHVLHNGDIIRSAICCFYISNEGLSILENGIILGLPIPTKIKKVLKQIKGDNKT